MASQRNPLLWAAAGALSTAAVGAVLLATGAIGEEGEPAPRAAAASAPSAPTPREVYDDARRSVVLVEARRRGVAPPTGPAHPGDGVATGSGFVIDDRGHVVTNHHVVANRGIVTVGFTRDDARAATVVGRDPSTDLALLRIDRGQAPRFGSLPLGDSDDVRVGDPAIAIGNPFGLERTLTVGVVSATDREIDAPDGFPIADAVQTDAPINSGNSGGPLLDADGEVIGVISQSRGDGLGFAVPVDTVKDVVSQLLRNGEVRRAYLGVSTSEARGGARVEEITEGGPADDAGLRDGDVITEIAGQPTHSPGDVAQAVASTSPGDAIQMVARRGERRVELRVELAERP